MRRPLLFVCICIFVGIALWTHLINPLPQAGCETGWEGKTVLLIGQVYEKEYRISYGEEILVLYLNSILYSTEAEASYSQIKQAGKQLSDIIPTKNLICEVNLSMLPKENLIPPLGCEVILKGQWQSISHATNPGEFDAANYYWIMGIGARLKDGELLGIGKKFWHFREGLYQLREHLLKNLYVAFPEKEASILAKMLLGVGNGLDEEVQELYQNNGIVHILSISGLHITLLGMGLYKGLRRLGCPVIISAMLGGFIIVCYGMMTGFGISASRAIGMYLLHMLGEIWGRTYDMLTAMGVLAVVLLVHNPLLVYHSGFLLSFSSVCGVGLLSGLLQFPKEWFRKKPGERQIISYGKKLLQKTAGGFSVSLAVTLFTFPIQLFFFYKIPLYSVFINLFVIPPMGMVMLLGVLIMVLPGLFFLSPIEIGLFKWFELLCYGFEKLPGHTMIVGRPAMWKILLYYVLLLFLLLVGKKIQMSRRLGMLAGLVLLMILKHNSQLKITILDVGQGDCICVQTGQGHCFLFDGGSSSRQNVGEKVILPFLLHSGINRVDAVFLSHGDIDHYSGIIELLGQEEIPVEILYLPDVGNEAGNDFEPVLQAAEKVQVQYVSQGDRWEVEEMRLNCLHPHAGIEADSNAYSACYLLQEKGFSMLFTGDVEGVGEELLITELEQREVKSVDVLKVSHHGSRNATSEDFLEGLDMKHAIISYGRNNSYGHPHTETVKRLERKQCNIMGTAEYGAITIEWKETIRVYGFTKK